MDVVDDFFRILLLCILIFFLLRIIIYIIRTIGLWKIFTKSKEEGWKSIIPIYNTYTLCKITGISPYWLIVIIGGSLLITIPIINFLLVAASIYFKILLSVSLAKSFGKEESFAVGIFFLPSIFYLILGFNSSSYQGAHPMTDIVFGAKQETKEINFCTNCGAPLTDDSVYCSSCGTKIN